MAASNLRYCIKVITKRLYLSKLQGYEISVLKRLIKRFGINDVVATINTIERDLVLAEPVLFLKSMMEGQNNKERLKELISGLDRNKEF